MKTKYKGVLMAQTPKAVTLWKKVLEEIKPKRVIEIGTYRWGMTLFFSEHCKEFYTYDIKQFPTSHTELLRHFKKADVFAIEEEIGELIQKEGITLVYCDGGNKQRELALFADWLKPGDYIATHDWGTEVTSAPKFLKEVFSKECDKEGMTRIFHA